MTTIIMTKEMKRLICLISCIFLVFTMASLFYVKLVMGVYSVVLFLLSFLAAGCVTGGCFWYFYNQQQKMEEAVRQISQFISGDTDVRIECDEEGSLYKLFHAVNILATTLDTHAAREQSQKEFLKNTISDISHQLKTPLAALAIYHSLIQEECREDTIIREFAWKSEKEIERIEALVQNLLKITKLDAGSIVMERQMELISDLIEEIRLRFETRAELEQKTVLISGEEEAELLCDRGWVLEAVSNLVKNALDHTDAGNQITITWRRLPAVTQITVKDNGWGIHPEDIHHIFKRFYRSRFSKDTKGLGLGLPLAKAIVKAHDGSILVESEWGRGSTFVMSFLNITKV